MHAQIFAIGDIQGCLDELLWLVQRIDREAGGEPPDSPLAQNASSFATPSPVAPTDALTADTPNTAINQHPLKPRLWLVGDLVNRGPKSLEVLRWVRANEDRVNCVLGNHDLHLLAVAAGIRAPHHSDTLDEILAAPDADELIDWVRRQPLAHLERGHLMVHAGLLPQWTAQRAVELAAEVQAVLAGPRWRDFLREMYGNTPDRWSESLTGADRLRVIVNALTRLRYCTPDGTMEFKGKLGPEHAPAGYLPWFEVADRASKNVPIVFGHWSTLGLVNRPNLLALDTGCIWGGPLSAVRLSDRRLLQAQCAPENKPGID